MRSTRRSTRPSTPASRSSRSTRSVTAPGAYNLSNDQEQYAYLGAKWLFEQMGKKGAVVYMRGIAGHPADTDRDTGFKKALAEYPGHHGRQGDRRPSGTRRPAPTRSTTSCSSGTKFDGIWTSGIDNVIVDALKTANHARADRRRGQRRLRHPAPQRAGPQGRGRDQPAGRRRRRRRPRHAAPRRQEARRRRPSTSPRSCGTTRPTRARRPHRGARSRALPDMWPLGLTIKDWTTYTQGRLIACKGPGE